MLLLHRILLQQLRGNGCHHIFKCTPAPMHIYRSLLLCQTQHCFESAAGTVVWTAVLEQRLVLQMQCLDCVLSLL